MARDHRYPEEIKTDAITRQVRIFIYEREAKARVERLALVGAGSNSDGRTCRQGLDAGAVERVDIDVYLPTGKTDQGRHEYKYHHTLYGKETCMAR